MLKLFFLAVSVCFLTFNSSQVFSASESQASSSCTEQMPCGLGFNTRFAKSRWLELQPYVGEYLGNRSNNSWAAGGRFGIRVTDGLTVGAEFTYSYLEYSPTSSFGMTVTDRNVLISNVYASYAFPILQRAGKNLQEMDLFTTLGIGNIRINSQNNLNGLVGGGLRMYFKPGWFAIRFDVNTYMYSLKTASGSKFNDDWIFTAGPDFFLFPKKLKDK